MTAAKNRPTTEHESFGPYEVYERLGMGGMATVHRAKERGIEDFERIVALKRLLPHLAEDESFVRSFVREAKLASMLQHPNIVQLYELGRVGAVYFISMELIEGRDVRKILRQSRRAAGPPPLGVFIALMTQLCDALEYAHRRTDQHGEPLGLVHRDVSPSNLLITRSGHLKVIDFGIAKAQTQNLRTQTGRIKGKLAYMAPEAIKAQELDARSDIFAAGVIAHELLTSRPLFASKNEYQTIMRVQRAEVEPPSTHNFECPPELDDIVLAALARDAGQRWSSAADMRDALRSVGARYQVSSTNHDVAQWMEWAFSLEPSNARQFPRPSSYSESRSPLTYGLPSAPQRAFARPNTPGLRTRTPTGATPAHAAAGLSLSLPDDDPPSDIRTAPLVIADRPGAELLAEAGAEDEEQAVDFAWGAQEREQGTPVLLDEVPDVSHKAIRVQDVLAEAARQEPTNRSAEDQGRDHPFGAGVLSAGKPGKGRLVLVLAALAAVGAALAAFVAVSQRPPAAPPQPRTATVEFVIEPADADIAILGYGTHQGSPYGLEVEAPGTYRVEIARPGYTSYVTELEVEGGEKNVVRVTLAELRADRHRAQVVVRSSPSGQRVVLDGEAQDQRTPVTLEVTPGAHVLAIHDRHGAELWRHEFEAAADTQYEFLPALPDEREDQRKRKHRRARRRSSAPVAAVQAPIADSAAPRGRASASATVSGWAGATSSAVFESLSTTAPPTVQVPNRPPPRPMDPAHPITVPPTAVDKRSGTLPSIPATRDDVPSHASAKLCIDARGKVISAQVLTSMPSRARSKLRRALTRWRYAPYVRGGVAVPACFAVNFKLAARR